MARWPVWGRMGSLLDRAECSSPTSSRGHMGYASLHSPMTEAGCQVEASLWTSVILHLFYENGIGNKDAGVRKKVAHPGHRELSVGPRTHDGGGTWGITGPTSSSRCLRKRSMSTSRLG